MARSSQDSSSTRASHNNRFIRRVHNSENRRTPYGTEHLHSPMRRHIHESGYPSQISFHFTLCFMPTHAARPQYLRTSVEGVQTPAAGRGSSGAGYPQQTQNAGHTYVPGHNIGPAPFLHTDVAGPEYPRDWRYPQPSGGFTIGAQMDVVRPGSVTGVQTPAIGLGPAVPGPNIGPTPFLHTDVAGPEYPRDWRYPQPSGGLYNGGFTSGSQMDAVRPRSVTGVQTPAVGLGPAVPGPNICPAPFLHTDVAGPEYPRDWRYPQPSGGLYNGGFTSGAQMDTVRTGSVTGVQTPAVGLGPAGSSGVGYNQLSPIATSGFAGQTLQAPIVPEYDTQAAATPPTLDQQLFPPSLATAANNAFAEEFLPPAVSDNFMHMIGPHF